MNYSVLSNTIKCFSNTIILFFYKILISLSGSLHQYNIISEKKSGMLIFK